MLSSNVHRCRIITSCHQSPCLASVSEMDVASRFRISKRCGATWVELVQTSQEWLYVCMRMSEVYLLHFWDTSPSFPVVRETHKPSQEGTGAAAGKIQELIQKGAISVFMAEDRETLLFFLLYGIRPVSVLMTDGTQENSQMYFGIYA